MSEAQRQYDRQTPEDFNAPDPTDDALNARIAELEQQLTEARKANQDCPDNCRMKTKQVNHSFCPKCKGAIRKQEKLNARIAELEQQLAEAKDMNDFLGEQIDELGNHLMLNHQSDFGVNREKPLGEGACEMAIRLLSKQGVEG